jgi:hypothetical protein
MKHFIRQMFRRNTRLVSPRTRRPRLGLEALEDRQLLSASPLTFATVSDSTYAAGTVAGAKVHAAVPLGPMMDTVMQGAIPGGQAEVVRVHLSGGEALTAETQSQIPIVTGPQTMSWIPMPFGPAVSVLTATGSALPGVTTLSDNGLPALGFRANRDGDYFIRVSNAPYNLANYLLALREVGIDSGNVLPHSYLQDTSNVMYAALSGNVLSITGPTGHGFGIKGNWRQTTATDAAGLVTSTYTASGLVYLETAVGMVPMKLAPRTSLVLTTAADVFGQFVGVIDSFTFKADLGIGTLATNFNTKFGLDLGSWQGVGAVLPGLQFGLKLGDADLESETNGAPLNPAVPYLYADFSTNLGMSFGNINVSPSDIPGFGYSLDMVLDPADPMLYLHVGGIPGLDDVAAAASNHGLIPFNTQNQPDGASGQVFGHVYMHGSLNLATLTDNEVPVVIKGDTVINLDSLASTGFTAGGRTVSQLLKSGAAGAWQVLSGTSIGINGEIDLTVSLGNSGEGGSGGSNGLSADLSLPAIEGTMIYDASARQFALKGAMPNALSGMTFLAGTPLEALTQDNADVDGTVSADGHFSLSLTRRLDLLEGQTTGTVTVDNAGVHGSVDFALWGFNKTVSLTGSVGFDGTYSFTGDLGLSLLGEGVDVSLTVDNQGIHGSADVNVLGYDVHVQGDVDPSGSFRLVGNRIMNVGEAGWSFFQVAWDQNGLTIDNGSLFNFYTRLKETWGWGGHVVKDVWDTVGNHTRETWSSFDAHFKQTWDAAGNYLLQTWGANGLYIEETTLPGGTFIYESWDAFTHFKSIKYTFGGIVMATVTETWFKVVTGIYQVGDHVKEEVDAAGNHVRETWYQTGNYVKETWDSIGNYTYEMLDPNGQVINNIVSDVEAAAQQAGQAFTDVWNELWGN